MTDELRPWREGNERIAIFIDGSNLYHALEESCSRTDLDFAAFIQWIAGERPLFRTYYYNIIQDEKRRPTEYAQQQRFLQALHLIPYVETRFGTTRVRGDQIVEKGVDIMLATDLLYYAWQDYYDMAVLVSGDGDFAYAIQTLKNLGKYVQVVTFESNQSPDLWEKADLRTLLTPDLLTQENLWVNKEPARKRRRRTTNGTTRRTPRKSTASSAPASSNGRAAEPVAAQ